MFLARNVGQSAASPARKVGGHWPLLRWFAGTMTSRGTLANPHHFGPHEAAVTPCGRTVPLGFDFFRDFTIREHTVPLFLFFVGDVLKCFDRLPIVCCL